jgi:hypothetical protein
VKRGLEHPRQLLDVLHEPRVLDDRHRDAVASISWNASVPISDERTCR